MELTPLLAGAVFGMALGAARLWMEQIVASHEGADPKALFQERASILFFIVASTAANVYDALMIASGAPQVYERLSALIALALTVASQLLVVTIALKPSRRDLDLALIACAPFVYLFVLWTAAQLLNSYTLWLF